MALAVINAIWIGPRLGPVQVACLSSFVRHGHRVVLYCYDEPEDVPSGVELDDASVLLPKDRMFLKRNNVSLFVDFLRYELLGAGRGLYVDCDVFCLRPIEDAHYIFAGEDGNYLNVAVLKLPRDCPTLTALRSIKEPNFWPPWRADTRRRLPLLKPEPFPLKQLKLGTTGPHALTYYAKQHGIHHLASPVDRFYPVHYRNYHLLRDPALSLAELITHRTDAIHLTRLSSLKLEEISPKSPLGQMLWGEVSELKPPAFRISVAGLAS